MRLIKNTQLRWVRDNLFSSMGSTILSLITGYMTIVAYRGTVGFILSPMRQWSAITYNMQLYMIFNYMEEESWRAWASVGVAFVLAGITLGYWNTGEKKSFNQIAGGLFKTFSTLSLLVLFSPSETEIMNNDGSRAMVEVISSNQRINFLIPIAVVALLSFLLSRYSITRVFNKTKVLLFYLGLPVALGWIIKIPTITFDAAGARIKPDLFLPVATTTTIPWTILYGALWASFFVGQFLQKKEIKSLKRTIPLSWLVLPLYLFSWLYKKPVIELNKVLMNDIPGFLIFSLIGFLIIRYITDEKFSKYRNYLATGFFLATAAILFLRIPFLIKVLTFSVVLLLLVAPSLANSKEGKRQLLIVWLVAIAVLTFLLRGSGSPTGIITPTGSFLGGFSLTWVLAIFGTYVSFPFGVLLALGRTSSLPLIRIICTGVIEIVRSVPYITWLFFASVMLTVFMPEGIEFNLIIRVLIVTAFFSGAYFAENIRGGLQSVSKGQYEAANAIGMNPFQRIFLIILPQALRAVVPTLVGSVITAFKDSSLVAIIGLFDVLRIGSAVIPTQSNPVNFVGTQLDNILFIAIFYWIFCFTFSRRTMKIEKKLGLGER